MGKGQFDLVANLVLKAPANTKEVAAQIRNSIGGVTTDIDIKIKGDAGKKVKALNDYLDKLSVNLVKVASASTTARQAIDQLATSFDKVRGQQIGKNINDSTKALARTSKATRQATNEIQEFGRQSAFALKRFTAFTIATAGVFGFVFAVQKAIGKAIQFQDEVVKISQVTGNSVGQLSELTNEVTRLARQFGVSSESLLSVSQIIAQAGFSAKDTKIALEALAKSSLAPTFKDITNTTEASIAAIAQFKIETKDLENVLGSINAVSAAYAVESEDLTSVIRRTGGVFASASAGVGKFTTESERGVRQLQELSAIFTSVRSTTRESAETIATGLRTIFARIQRKGTIEFLKQFNIELEEAGKFVGVFEAFSRISEGLKGLDTRDIRFSAIVEELGGFRQIGKVIPAIKNFSVAQDALNVAMAGQGSLARDAILAQQALGNQIAKTRENFLAFIRELTQTNTFQNLAKGVLFLANSFIELGRFLKPVVPVLTALAGIKIGQAFLDFRKGFAGGLGVGNFAQSVGENVGGTLTGKNKVASPEKNPQLAKQIDLLTTINNSLVDIDSKIGFAIGGEVRSGLKRTAASKRPIGKAMGGPIFGGSGNKDDVPALLMAGEYVLNKKATRSIGISTLNAWNTGRVHKFGKGSRDVVGNLGGADLQQFQNVVDLVNRSVKSGQGNPVDLIKESSKVVRDSNNKIIDVLVKEGGELKSLRSLVGTDISGSLKTIATNTIPLRSPTPGQSNKFGTFIQPQVGGSTVKLQPTVAESRNQKARQLLEERKVLQAERTERHIIRGNIPNREDLPNLPFPDKVGTPSERRTLAQQKQQERAGNQLVRVMNKQIAAEKQNQGLQLKQDRDNTKTVKQQNKVMAFTFGSLNGQDQLKVANKVEQANKETAAIRKKRDFAKLERESFNSERRDIEKRNKVFKRTERASFTGERRMLEGKKLVEERKRKQDERTKRQSFANISNDSIIQTDSSGKILKVQNPTEKTKNAVFNKQLQAGLGGPATNATRSPKVGGSERLFGSLSPRQQAAVISFAEKKALQKGLSRDAFSNKLNDNTRVFLDKNRTIDRVVNDVPLSQPSDKVRLFGPERRRKLAETRAANKKAPLVSSLFPTFQAAAHDFRVGDGNRGIVGKLGKSFKGGFGNLGVNSANRLAFGSAALAGLSGFVPQDTAGGAATAGGIQGAATAVGSLSALGVTSVAGLGAGAVAGGAILALQAFADFQKSQALDKLNVASGKLENSFKNLETGLGTFDAVISQLKSVQEQETAVRKQEEFSRKVSLDGIGGLAAQFDPLTQTLSKTFLGSSFSNQANNTLSNVGLFGGIEGALNTFQGKDGFADVIANKGTLDAAKTLAGVDARRQGLNTSIVKQLRKNPNTRLSESETFDLAFQDSSFRQLFDARSKERGVPDAIALLQKQGQFKAAGERSRAILQGTASGQNEQDRITAVLSRLQDSLDKTTREFGDLAQNISTANQEFEAFEGIKDNFRGLLSGGGFSFSRSEDFGRNARELSNFGNLSFDDRQSLKGRIVAGAGRNAGRIEESLNDIDVAEGVKAALLDSLAKQNLRSPTNTSVFQNAFKQSLDDRGLQQGDSRVARIVDIFQNKLNLELQRNEGNEGTKESFQEIFNKIAGEAITALDGLSQQNEAQKAEVARQELIAKTLAAAQDRYVAAVDKSTSALLNVQSVKFNNKLALAKANGVNPTLGELNSGFDQQFGTLSGGLSLKDTGKAFANLNAELQHQQNAGIKPSVQNVIRLNNLSAALKLAAEDTSRFNNALEKAAEAQRKADTIQDFGLKALAENNPVEIFKQVQAFGLANEVGQGNFKNLNRLNLPNFLQQAPQIEELIKTFQGENAAKTFKRNTLVGGLQAKGLLDTDFGKSLLKNLDKADAEANLAKEEAKRLADQQSSAAQIFLDAAKIMEQVSLRESQRLGITPLTKNAGGLIPGGGPNRDTVPAMLTRGEFVMNRNATQANLSTLVAMNNGYNEGGKVKFKRDRLRYVSIGQIKELKEQGLRIKRDTPIRADRLRYKTLAQASVNFEDRRNAKSAAQNQKMATAKAAVKDNLTPDGIRIKQIAKSYAAASLQPNFINPSRISKDDAKFIGGLSAGQKAMGSRLVSQYKKKARGFNAGGMVSGGSTPTSGMDGLTTALMNFGRYVESLSKINIPDVIRVEVAPVQSVVTLVGETQLASYVANAIKGQMEQLIGNAISKQINPLTGESRDTFSV